MAKTAVLVGVIGMLMMQSVSGTPKINNDQDHVENAVEEVCILSAKLKIKGRASNLADLDWGAAGQSDPYMEVTAEDTNGVTERQKTSHRGGTNNPNWNDYIVFSERTWKKISVDIFDYDGSGRKPDRLCPTKVIDLATAGDSVTFNCNPGSATVDIVLEFTPLQ